jgi:Tfp pilus assembly protein PilF
VSLLEQYLRRAEDFEMRQDYLRAIRELREALQTNPRSAECHARLGQVYLKSNQATMAKIYVDKALEFDAENAVALDVKQQLEKKNRKATAGQKSSSKAKSQAKPKGGLFGLFGGKKK